MKPILRVLVWLPLAICWPVMAQTNDAKVPGIQTNGAFRVVLGTNWVYPWASLRTVGGQLYDVNYSEKWDFVTIPEGARVLNARYYGTDQPTDLTFVWGREPKDQQTVVVYNFPYDPGYFRHVTGEPGAIATVAQMDLRLFVVNIETNWSPLGWMRIGTRTYDYGLPYTNLVPVPAWVRVPVSQAPQPVAVIPPGGPLPEPGQMSDHDYFSGTLSNRLEHALNIASLPQKDGFLGILAERAAQEDDMDMVKKALQNITNQTLRDNAAGAAVRILDGRGMHEEAIEIANTIRSSNWRTLILQGLSH